jgi:hypothetical protein
MHVDSDIRAALENPESSATLLHAIVRRRYGEDWYLWEPVTVAMELTDDYKVEIPSEVMDKLCAIQVLIATGAFFQDIDAFLSVCGAFAEGDPMFDVFDPPTLEEVAWGLTEAALNREMRPFGSRIKGYVQDLLDADGYASADYPAVFKELLLDPTPDSDDIRRGLASTENASNLGRYIHEQLRDLVSQFNRIPSLDGLDTEIIEHGFMDAVVRGRR